MSRDDVLQDTPRRINFYYTYAVMNQFTWPVSLKCSIILSNMFALGLI